MEGESRERGCRIASYGSYTGPEELCGAKGQQADEVLRPDPGNRGGDRRREGLGEGQHERRGNRQRRAQEHVRRPPQQRRCLRVHRRVREQAGAAAQRAQEDVPQPQAPGRNAEEVSNGWMVARVAGCRLLSAKHRDEQRATMQPATRTVQRATSNTPMKLNEFIVKEAIMPELKATDRDGAIRELVSALSACGALPSDAVDDVVSALIKREQNGSTGFGKGVAVPHVKHAKVKQMSGTIGRSVGGVDFAALDHQPVYSVVLLLSPENQPQQHLQAMNIVFSNLRSEERR